MDGSFIVIVGPSGCGKSTTLRLVAGLESVTDGDIRKNGESLVGVEPKNRNVAMVFQNYALYPHMTAKRNMTFGLGSTGDFDDDEIERRVQEAADLLDIDDLRDPRARSTGPRRWYRCTNLYIDIYRHFPQFRTRYENYNTISAVSVTPAICPRANLGRERHRDGRY